MASYETKINHISSNFYKTLGVEEGTLEGYLK